MQLSPQQAKAFDLVARWYEDENAPQTFRLFGYAGTGKSTIAKHLASAVDSPVLSATFTGKAASVLRKKGMPQTQTIHSLVYRVRPPNKQAIVELMKAIENAPAQDVAKMKEELRELNRPVFELRTASEDEPSPLEGAGLIIIDECSMVDEQMGKDLESFGVKILVLGDPFQLPPVKGQGYFTDAQPDFLLTEIHRQAADNPIIRLATDVRSGGRLRYGSYGDSVVKHRSQLSPEELREATQVLVGRNATRTGRNKLIRSMLGRRDPLPVPGDRVICLKNNRKLGLYNGVMFEVLSRGQGRWINMQLRDLDEPDREPIDLSAHEGPFLGQDLGEMPYWQRKLAEEFDYAYAITVHKSQGSQWQDVLIENESYCFRDMAPRWLYTAITRAEEKVTVVL